jgi:threonine dehydratase
MTVGARDVEQAAERLVSVVAPTPVERSPRLSDRVGGDVFLKREDLQAVRSYKVRGAYNLISQLPEADRARGVVCASAGNHAQGLAFACRALGVHGKVFLPGTTPRQKRDRIAVLGGGDVEVLLVGDTYDDAAAAALADAAATGATTLVPGRSTTTRDHRRPGHRWWRRRSAAARDRCPTSWCLARSGGRRADRPEGAGGAGWGERHPAGARRRASSPAGADCLGRPALQGRATPVPARRDRRLRRRVCRCARGSASSPSRSCATAGAEPGGPVAEGRVCTEMLALYPVDGSSPSPRGAGRAPRSGDVVHVEPGAARCSSCWSGGNNDVSRYGEIVERAPGPRGRKHYFLVDFPQEPGALRRFLDEVLGPDDDITLFEYVKRNNRETGPALVGIELSRPRTSARCSSGWRPPRPRSRPYRPTARCSASSSRRPMSTVTVEKDGHVLLIGVDRAAKRNAWNLAVIEEVAAAYEQLATDDDVRVGVVFGHGDHFSAGLDLAEVLPAVQEHGPVGPVRQEPARPVRPVGPAGPEARRHGGAGHRLHAVDRARAGQRRRGGRGRRALPPARGRPRDPAVRRGDAAGARAARAGATRCAGSSPARSSARPRRTGSASSRRSCRPASSWPAPPRSRS